MPPTVKDLERAAGVGDLAFVQRHGPRFVHRVACYALHEASKQGHHQVVRELLRQGYSPCFLRNEGYWKKRTPLQYACERGHLLVVRELLSHEATDPNFQTTELVNDTALHLAAAAGQVSVIQELVVAGADLEILNSSGESPLHVAVREGQTEAVQCLCSLHASCHCVLHTAVHYSQLAALKQLLDHAPAWSIDVDEANPKGRTALVLACELGESQCALLLLRAGASLTGLEKVCCSAVLFKPPHVVAFPQSHGQAATTSFSCSSRH